MSLKESRVIIRRKVISRDRAGTYADGVPCFFHE